LGHSEDCGVHGVDIYPQKEQAEYLDDTDRFCRVEVVFRKISGREEQHQSYEDARDNLGNERVHHQRFEPCPILLHDKLRQKKIETLREPEIVVRGQEAHETEYPVQKPDFLDAQVT
jgi:hypothetical protein